MWYTRLYLQKVKSNTLMSYKAYEAWLLTQFGVAVKCLQLDRGSKYMSDKFTQYLKGKGIEHRVTMHDMPKHNGVAKQLN